MKSKITKDTRATTADNLEKKFDEGGDVSDYFDFSKPVVWGGERSGAGRKRLGKIRKQIVLPLAIVTKVEAIAKKKHLSFSATIESACAALR
ncbi:MAG: hypothetical protein WCO94_09350 [Verrucomicrobiota bacterium]